MCEVFNNKYYHVSANCIQSRNPLFCKSSICIPQNLQLTMEHMEYFRLHGVDLSSGSAQKNLINLNYVQKYIFPNFQVASPIQTCSTALLKNPIIPDIEENCGSTEDQLNQWPLQLGQHTLYGYSFDSLRSRMKVTDEVCLIVL